LGRILALDYGNKKIGVAISDPMKIIAKPLRVIINTKMEKIIDELNSLIEEFDIEIILVGMPITMKNTYSEQTDKVVQFINYLQNNLKIKIDTYDERLTSKMAEKSLILQGIRTGHNKHEIDKAAAAIFLQNYLDDPTK
jgi:putative Holliday junction resolvase